MAMKRVTMQDIANACGLSRNTVSKIFNGRGSVPEITRQQVLAKARELGYYPMPQDGEIRTSPSGNIALLTQHKLLSHNFGAYFITSFTDQISRAGYTIQIYEISAAEISVRRLPPNFDPDKTVGILGIELFDQEYYRMVCSLGIPTVFVDGYAHAYENSIRCDVISMENITSEMTLVGHMIAGGARRIGFVGDIEHCNSFYERWLGFAKALHRAGLPVDRELCILEKDSESYGDPDWFLEQLQALPAIPDAFACANDYIAIHLMTALKRKGLSIPGDVMIAGFDGSPESVIVDPALTTARIPSTDIGRLAAILLERRIQLPEFPLQWTYVKTTPIFGGSTR